MYRTSNRENQMVISHLNTHGRVDLAEWHGDSAMWIERTQLHQPICSLACNISNHRIRVFLQYIFALPALGFYYNQFINTFLPKRFLISDLILDGRLSHPEKAKSPIFVTQSGILMLLRDLHSQNVLLVDYQYYTL